MSGVIYLMHDGGSLVPMTEQAYDSEDILQRLLADYPDLLGGEQMNAASPRRWLLLAREAGLPSEEAGGDRWSVDHLFVDQDGIPTIVEVKRSTDSRIRREVVGQMLDYAANAVVHWPVERLRSRFESMCERQARDPEFMIADAFGVDEDPEALWKLVETNLQVGRIRLVFVADVIPPELRRVVEFLNQQMNPAEVLAVEVRQYAGTGQQALVPRVIGQTQQAVSQKTGNGRARESRTWDAASFMDELAARIGSNMVPVARQLLEWSQRRATRVRFGTGITDGTFYPRVSHNGQLYTLFTVGTDGRISIYFGSLKSTPQFADTEPRLELLRRLNELEGIALDAERIDLYPAFPISALTSDDAATAFLNVFDWVVDELNIR